MLLEAKGIHKRFGGVQVLVDTWIQGESGRIVGMIGPNGAGKSTFLAVLSKFLEPEKGHIFFGGKDITRAKPHEIARRKMVRTFQVPREFGNLTVLENLLVAPKNQIGEKIFGAWLRWPRIKSQERQLVHRANEVLDFLNLEKVRNLPARKLSGGQKKLLELGRALMLDPSVLLLDEPFSGVNPALIDEIIERLFALRQQGLCLIVVEHNMYTIRALCDDLFVLVEGKILTSGRPTDVFEDPRVLDAYLGRGDGADT
jgi:branched-chain amino acid transport system ATP-binding protein